MGEPQTTIRLMFQGDQLEQHPSEFDVWTVTLSREEAVRWARTLQAAIEGYPPTGNIPVAGEG